MLKLDELICAGKNEEGNPCKRQLAKDMKFCPECGTPVKKKGGQSVSGASPQLPEQSTEDSQANDSSDDEDNGQGGAGDHNITGSGSAVTLDQTQYARCRFVVDDVLTRIMREYMEQSALPPEIIERTIMKYKTFKDRLSQKEMSIIQTLPTEGFKHFEISLMYKIARNKRFSMLIPDKPTRDWGSDPQHNETTIGDNIERIRICRNKTSHKAYPSLQEKEFNNLFTTFINIAKRAKEHLQTENFEDSILHYKTCSLDKDMEEKLKKYIQQIKSLKKLLDTVLKTNLHLKVYIDQLSQATVEDIRHKGTAEGVTKSTITVTGIEHAQEKAELLNSRKSELATESIVFNYADEGSLLIYVDITTSLFQDQNLLCRQIKQFMQLVFEVADLQCSIGECNAFLSILEENYDTASEGDNSGFDEPCSSTNNLVLHVEVKEEAMMTDELLSQNVHDFLGNVVTKMNGTPITQGEEITAIIGVEETGEKKIKVESIQQTDSFKEDKFDEDTKKNENFETRKQYKDDVTRKFSNEKELKDEKETNSATDCSGSELSSSGTENVPIGQYKRKQYKDGHQKKKMKVTDKGESSVIKEEKTDDRKRKQSMIGKGKKKVKVEDEGGSSVDPQTSGDISTQIGQMETVFGTTKDKVNIQEKYEEPQAGPSTSRFEGSFIFGNIGKNTNENSSGGKSSVPIKEAKESDTEQKKQDQAETEKTVPFKKDGNQDKDTSEDDSSDSKDSDSRKSGKDNIEKEEESAGKKKKKREERKKKGSSKGDTDAKPKPETKSDKPDKMDGTRLTKAGNGSGNADKTPGRRQMSSTLIDVCFNAVISPTILSNSETDSVVVVFPGYSPSEYKMKLDRFISDGYIVGSVTVPIAKDLVSGNYRQLNYNYKVFHGEAKGKATSEYFHISGRRDGCMRQVLIPSKYLSQGFYNSYDGIIREDPRIDKSKGFWSKKFDNLKDSVKKLVGKDDYLTLLKEDAQQAVLAFLPDWQLKSMSSDGVNGKEMISLIVNINEGLRSVYVKQMDMLQGNMFDRVFAKGLMSPIKKIIHELERRKTEKLDLEAKTLCLVTAVTVTHIVVEFEVHLARDERRMLCEALLPSPDFDSKTSLDVEEAVKFLPKDIKNVSLSVLKFSRNIAENTSDPSWMFCVPMIHFLLKKCKPFEEAPAEVDHDETKPEWWGIVEYRRDIDTFKRKSKWERPHEEIVAKLTPYFDVDYFLPRTLIGSLNLDMLFSVVEAANNISPDIILASMYYYLKSGSNYELIKKIIHHMSVKTLNMELDITVHGLVSAYRTYRISADLLVESLKHRYTHKDIPLLAIEVFLISLDAYDRIQSNLDPNKKVYTQFNITKDGHLKKFEDFKGKIIDCLGKDFRYKELEFLQRWNSAFKLKVPNGKIKVAYTTALEKSLLEILQNKGSFEKLIEIYCEHTESFGGVVQEILTKVALTAVNECDKFEWRSEKDERCIIRLGVLLSNVFERSWDVRKLDDPHAVFQHALSWRPFPTYMEIYCNKPKALGEECQKMLKKFVEIIQDFVQRLLEGTVLVKTLRKLTEKHENFQKLIMAMKFNNVEVIMNTLAIRSKELQAFDQTYQVVQEFTHVSIHCKANTASLLTKLQVFQEPDMISLNKLVTTELLENLKDPENYKPMVTVFGLRQDELDILPKIIEHCKGLLFIKIWEKKGTELQKKLGRDVKIDEVFDKVWQPALEQWRTLSKKLRSGDMHFSEFDKWFKTKDRSNLKKEFLLFDNDGDDSWIKERLDQIERHGNIRNYLYGAKAIMEVVDAFNLKGNFDQIKDIIKLTGGQDTVMKKLDQNLLTTCSILGEVTPERSECLKDFIKCKPLVDWIKESMPGGLKELKVFVDLASISAGEGDMEIAKVNCLHSATTGYAPLIFNLEKHCNTKIFLEKCQEVWKELDSNPQLPQKLLDTKRQLDWLQSVKKSHGSVEVTSLAQAEAINGKGIYQVGNIQKKTFLKIPELTDVLELRVPEEEGNMAQRNHYRYDQLHDLQSRLMLVAGKAEKGKDDVDRFMLYPDHEPFLAFHISSKTWMYKGRSC